MEHAEVVWVPKQMIVDVPISENPQKQVFYPMICFPIGPDFPTFVNPSISQLMQINAV